MEERTAVLPALNQMSGGNGEKGCRGTLEAMEDYVKKSMALGILFLKINESLGL